jgi:hypothetical protein
MERDHLGAPLVGVIEEEEEEEEEKGTREPSYAAHVGHFDLFFTKLYEFWRNNGCLPIILHEATKVINLGFTGVLTSLLFFLNWSGLISTCTTESTCNHSLRNYCLTLRELSPLYRLFVLSYISLFAALFLAQASSSAGAVADSVWCNDFWILSLGFKRENPSSVPWGEVMARVISMHEKGQCLVKCTSKS